MKADQQTFIKNLPFKTNDNVLKKQGRIHGNPVAGGWAGAVMRNPIGIQKCYRRTDRPTQQGVESRVRDLKQSLYQNLI